MENDKFNVLFVGRLEKRKGLQYLLRAWELVQQMRPASRLTVIGAFRQKQLRSYQRQVSDLRLRDVIFRGFVSDDEKRRHLQSADVYCSPATGGESQGIALLEAMAAGTPVVASDIPGFRTVLVERNAAILVPPKDHVALARSLVRLARNPEKRQQLASSGQRRAHDFAWSTIADRVIAYYEELVNESEIGGPYWTQSADLVGTGHPE
jgi:phosphatidylinositol alpha-mannosyltransferase